MARKKLPKDIDLTQKMNPADGFFTAPETENHEPVNMEGEKINAPVESSTDQAKKNLGGRPQKKGLKNEQFTLTMHPKLYEQLRIIAQEKTDGNFSALIENAIRTYCDVNNINLDKIKIDPSVLEAYKKKQDRKRRKIK